MWKEPGVWMIWLFFFYFCLNNTMQSKLTLNFQLYYFIVIKFILSCWNQNLVCLENYCIVSLGNVSTTKQAPTALLFSPSAEVLQQVYQDLLLCSAAVPQKATMAICLHYKLREWVWVRVPQWGSKPLNKGKKAGGGCNSFPLMVSKHLHRIKQLSSECIRVASCISQKRRAAHQNAQQNRCFIPYISLAIQNKQRTIELWMLP